MIRKPIPGFPNYAADENGNIWSYCGGKWFKKKNTLRVQKRQASGRSDRLEYYTCLYINKKYLRRRIALLIILAFRGPKPFAEAQCRHLDGNSLNNNLNNLRWGSPSDNSKDTARLGKQKNQKLLPKDVKEIRCRLENGDSLDELARDYGVGKTSICNIKHGWNWKWLR